MYLFVILFSLVVIEMSDVVSADTTKFVINTMESRIASYTSIQGVISAGKSTFIKRLKLSIQKTGQCAKTCTDLTKSDYYLLIGEPVDEWVRVKCSTRTINQLEPEEEWKSLLDTFYMDKRRWALAFQVYAFSSRLDRIIEEMNRINPLIPASARIHIISERSLRTDYLFFRNLRDSDKVAHIEWLVYEKFFNLVCGEIVKKEDMMIYIDTNPIKCFERLKKRDREAETNHCTTEEEDTEFRDYLVSLDVHHKRMISEFKLENGTDKVYVVDGNTDITSDEDYDAVVAHFRLSIK